MFAHLCHFAIVLCFRFFGVLKGWRRGVGRGEVGGSGLCFVFVFPVAFLKAPRFRLKGENSCHRVEPRPTTE